MIIFQKLLMSWTQKGWEFSNTLGDPDLLSCSPGQSCQNLQAAINLSICAWWHRHWAEIRCRMIMQEPHAQHRFRENMATQLQDQ